LSTARFLYATGRDRSWGRPLDVWLDAIHPRFASPLGATLLSGGVGIAACLMPLQLLLMLSGSGLIVIYAGITAAVVAGRRGRQTLHARYHMPFYPAAPIVAGIALAGVTYLNWLDPAEGRPALLATAAQVALALAYYRLVLRRRQWRGFAD
jgi:amino acid transporter